MKILAINGSMRKKNTTVAVITEILGEIKKSITKVESELIHIAEQDIHPCKVVCSNYCKTHPFQCSVQDDVLLILEKMKQADVLLIGTPLYFRGPPAKFHSFIERLVSIFYFLESESIEKINSPLMGKHCGLIGVAEYSNPHGILEYLHDFCNVLQIHPLPLENFPYLGVACQGELKTSDVFNTPARIKELADAIVNTKKQ